MVGRRLLQERGELGEDRRPLAAAALPNRTIAAPPVAAAEGAAAAAGEGGLLGEEGSDALLPLGEASLALAYLGGSLRLLLVDKVGEADVGVPNPFLLRVHLAAQRLLHLDAHAVEHRALGPRDVGDARRERHLGRRLLRRRARRSRVAQLAALRPQPRDELVDELLGAGELLPHHLDLDAAADGVRLQPLRQRLGGHPAAAHLRQAAAHRRAREPAAAELRSSWVRRSWRARGSMPSGPRLRRASSSAVRIRTARRRSSRFSRRSWRAAAALSGASASASPPPVLRASSRICSSRLGESAPPTRAFAGDLLGERERVGRCGDDSCSTPATISHATAGPVSRSCFIVRASTTARSTFAFRRHDSHRVWSGLSRSKRFEHDAQNALCVVAYTCSSEGLTLTRTRLLDGGVASGARPRPRLPERWRWRSGMSSEIAQSSNSAVTELRVASVDGSPKFCVRSLHGRL